MSRARVRRRRPLAPPPQNARGTPQAAVDPPSGSSYCPNCEEQLGPIVYGSGKAVTATSRGGQFSVLRLEWRRLRGRAPGGAGAADNGRALPWRDNSWWIRHRTPSAHCAQSGPSLVKRWPPGRLREEMNTSMNEIPKEAATFRAMSFHPRNWPQP